jgi:hypothetical protein
LNEAYIDNRAADQIKKTKHKTERG